MDSLLDVPGLRARTDNRFRSELVRRATAARLNADYIAAVISLESGFKANIQNMEGYNALGLIQFGRRSFEGAAKRAGVNARWEDLRWMSAEQQLPIVIAYFQATPVREASSATEYYTATFLPLFTGYPASTVLGKQGSEALLPGQDDLTLGEIYAGNRSLDVNQDGLITIGDLRDKIEPLVSAARARARVPITDEPASSGSPVLAFLALGAAPFFFYAWKHRNR